MTNLLKEDLLLVCGIAFLESCLARLALKHIRRIVWGSMGKPEDICWKMMYFKYIAD